MKIHFVVKKRNGRITDGFVSHTSNDATWRKSDVTIGTRRGCLSNQLIRFRNHERIRFGYKYSFLFFYSYTNKLSDEKSFYNKKNLFGNKKNDIISLKFS